MWIMRMGMLASALVLIGAAALALALRSVTLVPPPTTIDLNQAGPGRSERVKDIHFIWLAGPPELRGVDMQRLVGNTMERIDASMHATFRQVVPSAFVRSLIEVAGRLFARDLDRDIPVHIQREIVGQMAHFRDAFGDGGGKYARFLAYLALHDLAQTIEQSPLIACSGFAVTGAQSASGGTIVGRNFDFEAGSVFDEEKSVTVVTPDDGGLRTASIAWPGMNGIVTGVNEKRVWLSVNAARSDHERSRGMPVSLQIRNVLEHAHDAREAARMLAAAQTRVADLYLIADPREAFVVEKTPLAFFTRTMRRDKIVVANHFSDPKLRAELRNLKLEGASTSVARNLRLEQLVYGEDKARTPADALAILRDRKSPRGDTYALGDRRALDGYIATHGAFADFGRDILYLSRAPHLSNSWVGIALAPLFAGRVEIADELPADPATMAAGKALGERIPGQ